MTPIEFKSHLLTVPEQISEYFAIILEAAVEAFSQDKLTSEQLRQYRKSFQSKEMADIDTELAALDS